MNKKLYVGNLSYEVTQDDLKELFSKAGEVVEVVLITDRYSGRSKGFGFVEMKSEEEAKKAIEMYNNKEYKERKMMVNVARPREPRENRERSSRRY